MSLPILDPDPVQSTREPFALVPHTACVADLPDEVTGLAIAPDGRALLVGQWGELRLWSVPECREIRRLARPGKPMGDVFQVTFSPDGSMIASDLGVVDVGACLESQSHSRRSSGLKLPGLSSERERSAPTCGPDRNTLARCSD